MVRTDNLYLVKKSTEIYRWQFGWRRDCKYASPPRGSILQFNQRAESRADIIQQSAGDI